jgi:hypothetical protein
MQATVHRTRSILPCTPSKRFFPIHPFPELAEQTTRGFLSRSFHLLGGLFFFWEEGVFVRTPVFFYLLLSLPSQGPIFHGDVLWDAIPVQLSALQEIQYVHQLPFPLSPAPPCAHLRLTPI